MVWNISKALLTLFAPIHITSNGERVYFHRIVQPLRNTHVKAAVARLGLDGLPGSKYLCDRGTRNRLKVQF